MCTSTYPYKFKIPDYILNYQTPQILSILEECIPMIALRCPAFNNGWFSND